MIAAEGEQKASRALREAADVIATSQSAIQLRYLQAINIFSREAAGIRRLSCLVFFYFTDSKLDFRGEKLNDHFPDSHRHHQQVYEEERKRENEMMMMKKPGVFFSIH